MDKILLAMAIFLFSFIVIMTTVFCLYQATPDTLIVSVFSVCGVECGVMGTIKNRKEAIRARLQELEQQKKHDEEGSGEG